MSEIHDELLSAGTATETVTIQLLETMALVSAASVAGLSMAGAYGYAIVAAVLAVLSVGTAYLLRRERLLRNEIAARDAQSARYSFPKERTDTLDTIPAPDDVRKAARDMVGGEHLSRADIAAKLTARMGPSRATEYLPIILQYADRDAADTKA